MSKAIQSSDESRIATVLKRAEREWDWLAQHREVLAPYRGQWVVVHGHRVVAHSPDGSEAARLAPVSEYPGAVFEYIPTVEEREAVLVV